MSSIFNSVLTGSLSVGLYLLCLFFAGLCGAITALALSRESTVSRSFLLSALTEGEISMIDYLVEIDLYYDALEQALAAERDYRHALASLMVFSL